MIVYTGGTFDLFHYGHVNFLEKCADIAGDDGKVIVAVNTDEFVQKYKKKRPVMDLNERCLALIGCAWVDDVVINESGADSKPTIIRVKPDVVAISSDWARRDYYKQMQFTQDWLDVREITLAYIPHTPDISSTDIRSRLRRHGEEVS